MKNYKKEVKSLLNTLGVHIGKGEWPVFTPINNSVIATIHTHSEEQVKTVIEKGVEASAQWAKVQAPTRGLLLQIFGQVLEERKADLAKIITFECGKPYSEGLGEVQEVIDLCRQAAGRSTMSFDTMMQSERQGYRLISGWHPIGLTGIISAFNFPFAVIGWNVVITVMCGNGWIAKPSEVAPLSALTLLAAFKEACKCYNSSVKADQQAPEYLGQVIIGDGSVGAQLVNDKRVPLISFTGSIPTGKKVGAAVTARMGRSILELGGNNPLIVAESADIESAITGIAFGVFSTTGQRCTSTRRIFVHRSQREVLTENLKKVFARLRKDHIGNPFDSGIVSGPLINQAAFDSMIALEKRAIAEGAESTFEGQLLIEELNGGIYTGGMILESDNVLPFMQDETFAPAVSIVPYDTLEEALFLANDVPQGLSSAIYTAKDEEWDYFYRNMQAGIRNRNTGTSGAEAWIGFGGMKETGWGRESGGIAYMSYMVPSSTAVHVKGEIALAQGIPPEIFKISL